MKAMLISIGDELLIGQTVNTNVSFLGQALSDNNIEIVRSTVVGDEESDILAELESGSKFADVVICTGGLGPTHDDITRTCVLKYFDTKLVLNEEVLKGIKERFARLKRTLNQINEEQALVPENAKIIPNKRGTAPGYILVKENTTFVFMPGVPYEMKSMFTESVLPLITEMEGIPSLHRIKTTLLSTGIPESTLFQKLGNLDELLKGAKLAFLPSLVGVKMRITVTDPIKENAANRLIEIEQMIRGRVGRFIYGKGEETLAEVVGRILKERGLTISVAESCTGGGIANQITDVAGSSAYFERAVVSYSNASKVEILDVDEDIIAKHGAVSEEVAFQMAQGIRGISGSDIGLSATGILGPGGGTPEKPVGTVYLGISTFETTYTKKLTVGEDRLLNKERIIHAALDFVRRHLLGIPT